jgi:hypothetical protein
VLPIWKAPVHFEVLKPERTGGGVSVNADAEVIADLKSGATFRKARLASGDPLLGMQVAIERTQVLDFIGKLLNPDMTEFGLRQLAR